MCAGDIVVYLTDTELATGGCDDVVDAAGTNFDSVTAEGRGGVITQGSTHKEAQVQFPPEWR